MNSFRILLCALLLFTWTSFGDSSSYTDSDDLAEELDRPGELLLRFWVLFLWTSAQTDTYYDKGRL